MADGGGLEWQADHLVPARAAFPVYLAVCAVTCVYAPSDDPVRGPGWSCEVRSSRRGGGRITGRIAVGPLRTRRNSEPIGSRESLVRKERQ